MYNKNVSGPAAQDKQTKTVARGRRMLSRFFSKLTQGKIMTLGCAASFVKSAPQFFHYFFSPAAVHIRLVID